VIGAVISTPVRGWEGGWDERRERRRWRGGAAGVPGLEREQRERNAFFLCSLPLISVVASLDLCVPAAAAKNYCFFLGAAAGLICMWCEC
jgi:hypothetical protein